MNDKPQDETIKDRIIGLLRKGYKRGQLISDFGFAERTVDAAVREYKENHADTTDEPPKVNDSDTKGIAIPPKLDMRQVIVPEFLIKHLSFVNGDQRQTFVDALLVYEAARRSVMEDVMILQGLAAAQAQITETQLRVLREAKSESEEVAEAAAEGAAARVTEQIQATLQQVAMAGSSNPMTSMLAHTFQPYLSQAMSRIFGMFPGLMPNQPGQPSHPTPPQGQSPTSIPGIEQASDEEIKEVFGD